MPDGAPKLSARDQAAIDLFRQHKARLEQQRATDGVKVQWRPMPSVSKGGKPNFDLTKADPDCKLCSGRGSRTEIFQTAGEYDSSIIICRCVARNGGIRQDAIPGGSPMG